MIELKPVMSYINKAIGWFIGITIIMLFVWGCLFAWRAFFQWL